jgi:hypothetical protein
VSGETGKPLDAPALLEVLERHRVQYVVVGGYAAELHGSVRRTVDVDVVPRTTADNLERLAAALREVQAKIRTEGFPEGLPFSPSGEAMVGIVMLNLVTKHGELDLNFTPSGTTGYDDLHTGATTFDVGPVHVHVASLADIIRSKTAAGRPKDFDALPELHQLAGSNTENDGRIPEATPGSAPELALGGYPDPIQPVTAQELAKARIDAARRPAAASKADGKQPPTQR